MKFHVIWDGMEESFFLYTDYHAPYIVLPLRDINDKNKILENYLYELVKRYSQSQWQRRSTAFD